MSTFYGGPQLSSVTSVQNSYLNLLGSAVLYQVPAGFFAKITGSVRIQATGNSSDSATVIASGAYISGPLLVNFAYDFNLTLPSGGYISAEESGQAAISYYIGIELYKNP